MRRAFKALVISAALLLASCAGNKEPPTAMDVSGQMDQALSTAQDAIIGYVRLTDCDLPHSGLCSADKVVVRIKPINDAAYAAVKAYEKAALDPATSNDALAAAKAAAVDALASLATLTAGFTQGAN